MSNWLRAYEIEPGDKGQIVRVLKNLLRSHSQVTRRLTNNDECDAVTVAAVADLQRGARCRNRSGSVDWETWIALGTGQHPAAIYHATFTDPLLRELLSAAQQQGGAVQTTTSQQLPTVQDVYQGRVKYTDEMQRCDDRLAEMFGEKGAYMAANGFDYTQQGFLNGKKTAGVPQYRGDYTVNGKVFVGHLSSYAAHMYGSSKRITKVYVPWYENIKPLRLNEYVKEKGREIRDEKGKKVVLNTIDLIYYNKIGNQTNVTLAILHINRLPPQREGDRLLIGTSNGPGGDGSGDELPHVHLELLPGNKTAFPAKRDRIPFNKLCL